MIKLIVFMTVLSINAYAQSPTIVYGKSELPDGQPDSVLLVQPKNAPNPLGNPIVDMDENLSQNSNTSSNISNIDNVPKNLDNPQYINQLENQNPKPFSDTPEQMENQIENTLYQGGNRIYDIQSYPINDINEITEPNIQPTITTYPEY